MKNSQILRVWHILPQNLCSAHKVPYCSSRLRYSILRQTALKRVIPDSIQYLAFSIEIKAQTVFTQYNVTLCQVTA